MRAIFRLLPRYHRILCTDQNRIQYHALSSYRLASTEANTEIRSPRPDIKNGPSLKDFIISDFAPNKNNPIQIEDTIPYVDESASLKISRKVYFYVFGCQMNVNDTEVVWSILKKNNFTKTDILKEADVVLFVTCSIREGAESKIWNHINQLKGLKRKGKLKAHLKLGILGCMAERLKQKIVEIEKSVDLVAGPDSYKDLPRLLSLTENNQTAINVLLSLDETYADVIPVRLNEDMKSAFVTIMRGCDNMCTYCIVPFTRGRERSRPVDSILDEIRHLSDQGVKEVTLLGQNVNSYRDLSQSNNLDMSTKMAKGFNTVYKTKKGGLRFADLLDKVSLINPEMRIRFTSPHPKDFPDEVLEIIKERKNICNSLHLPAQSGNSAVLERMRRGYSRESYLELVDHVRAVIPDVSLSTDMISGFCHETDEEFEDTLTLLDKVKYNKAFLFEYSMREKTTAHRRYQDDVPKEVKNQRLRQMNEIYLKYAEQKNVSQIGEIQLVLIDGFSRRSNDMLAGCNDGNTKVLIPSIEIPSSIDDTNLKAISTGDYIAVKIEGANSKILTGSPLYHTTLSSFDALNLENKYVEMKSIAR